jgi:uncharacterized coiled-coil DUF342 family protein
MCTTKEAEEIGIKLEKKLEVKLEKFIDEKMLDNMPQLIARAIKEVGGHLQMSEQTKCAISQLESTVQTLVKTVDTIVATMDKKFKENDEFHKKQDEIHEKTVPAIEKMTEVMGELKLSVDDIIPTYKSLEAEKNKYKNVKDFFSGTGKAIVQISVILLSLGVIITVLSGLIYGITNFDHIFKN